MILSARSEVEDKIIGLDPGANDYLSKPFHFKELEARIRALLRRDFIQQDTVLTHGDIKIDTALKRVTAKNQKVELTKKEYSILEYLVMNKNKIVSTEVLIQHVWDSEVESIFQLLEGAYECFEKEACGLYRQQGRDPKTYEDLGILSGRKLWMKLLNKITLRLRLTILTAFVLTASCVFLTISGIYTHTSSIEAKPVKININHLNSSNNNPPDADHEASILLRKQTKNSLLAAPLT